MIDDFGRNFTYHKGKKYWRKDILWMSDKSKKVIDQNGIHHNSMVECCVANNVDYRYACAYKTNNKGRNVEFSEIYNAYNKRRCYDHLGNGYRNIQEMCNKYKIKRSTYTYRVDYLGWSVEKALTTKPKQLKNISFINSKKYGISETYYRKLIKQGFNDDDIKNCRYVKAHTKDRSVIVNGKTYPSQTKACLILSVRHSSVYSRMKKFNETFEQAINHFLNLEKRYTRHIKTTHNVVFEGVTYKNKEMLFDALSISKSNVYSLKEKYKLSFDDAVRLALKNKEKAEEKCCYDHIGTKFKSKSEMCRYYNICTGTLDGRLKYGWELGDALTVPIGWKKDKIF